MEPASIVVRPASKSDLDTVWQMWKEVMDQKIYFPYDASYSRAQIEAVWINLDNPVYVAELDGRIAGAYILRPNQPAYGSHIANGAYMVSGSARGNGIGSVLCNHSIQTAKQLGYRGMQFNLVVSTNAAAIRVWKAHGFEIIGTVPGGFFQEDLGYVDAHIFFRSLV
ncbi:MAG: GNAT family N-acetyltransferase [Saprospiraceae bacterium]|nr:GNAT family N-acetyltransferase [Lewinella sp.]